MTPAADDRRLELRVGPRPPAGDVSKAERVTAMMHRYREAVDCELSFDAIRRIAAAENTDTHRREKIVGSVGVVVHTTVEDGRSVLSDTRGDESLSTRVFLDEVRHVVNDTSDSDESAAVLGFGLIGVPVDDGKLLERNTPVEGLSLLVELLL